ncbi:transposase [Methylobacterium sp. Leaf119]|nr:transposase-like protein [Methylorubrum extorquens PA1]KQP88689.1 transposase [Methylobacterium sp. Leaf119]WIU41032.1 hypothetical protein KQ926_06935 [Methylorubrum extorquens]
MSLRGSDALNGRRAGQLVRQAAKQAIGEAGRSRIATDDSVEIAFVDRGYTGGKPATAARKHGIELEVVKLPEASPALILSLSKDVLLPRRPIVERSFARAIGFRRLVKDCERYASAPADLYRHCLRLPHTQKS